MNMFGLRGLVKFFFNIVTWVSFEVGGILFQTTFNRKYKYYNQKYFLS